MSLQFIVGSAGSGKSTYLYQQVIQEALAHPKERYLVVVPEQFTMHTQQQLVGMHPAHSILNIDILSFERMAYRVFDELGTNTLQVLEETGKHLLLRKIVQEEEKHLGLLGKNMKRPGYIDEMKSLFSEFMQYDISPETLEDMIAHPKLQGSFSEKAKDIYVLYEAYRRRLSQQYITGEEVLQKLMEVAEESKLLRNATVVFDGFTGFTPIQNQFLQQLLTLAKKVMVTVTCDPKEALWENPSEEELFAMSKQMVVRLVAMAGQAGVACDDVIYMEAEDKGRFVPGGYMQHLEQNLFRPKGKAFLKQEDTVDEIQCISLSTPRQELTYVVCDIEKQVRQKGMRYRDFAIVCADMSTYAPLAPGVFEKLHMPYFLDEKRQIVFHPFVEFLKGLFLMLEENFSYESVMRYLRSDMTGLTLSEVDMLENYILASNIRGWKKYRETFAYVPERYTSEQVNNINEFRQTMMEPLEIFMREFPAKRGTVEQISTALYQVLIQNQIEEQLAEQAKKLKDAGQATKAKEYEQIYGVVMDLLDKMVAILGQEEVTFEAYEELLSTGLDSLRIGMIPPENDKVVMGDLERSRLADVKVLYLVGASDGAIPKAMGNGGMLSQLERMQWKEAGFELAPTDREKSFMQRFYLYFVMTQAKEKLVVSYARVDASGKGVGPSYLFSTLKRLFPKVPLQLIEQLPVESHMLTEEMARDYLVEGLRAYASGGALEQEFAAVLAWEQKMHPEELEQLLQGAYYVHKEEGLSQAAVDAVFGREMTESVSRMEQYARCAYSYFLKYGLQLQQRGEHTFATLDMGNLYHAALEHYSRALQQRKDVNWYTISAEQQKELLQEAIWHTYQTMKKTQVLDTARDAYVLRRMEKTLEQTVWALTEQVRGGSFIPKAFEVDFSQVQDSTALSYAIDDMHRLRLRGKIDRIDVWEQQDKVYVKIVDYKSGQKDLDYQQLYHGLQVQLVLYLHAAMEGLQKEYKDKQVLPGAMFYYHINRPLVPKKMLGKDAKEDLILQELCMRGVVNQEELVIENMHYGLQGKSNLIPVKKNADGTLAATSKILSQKQFQLMGQFVQNQMRNCGKALVDGKIDCRPFKQDKKSVCEYCEYHGVCGFDASMPGYGYREATIGSNKEEILQQMERDIEAAKAREEGGQSEDDPMDQGTTTGN